MERKLRKGDAFKDDDGRYYVIFEAIDDSYTYVYIANFSNQTVIKMRPNLAKYFVRKMKPVDLGFSEVEKREKIE